MPTLPVLAIAALLASGGAATPRSDLVVRAVSASSMSVQAGKSFTASATIANRGRRKARRSQVRFSLAPAAGSELGVVRALRPRTRSASQVTLTVPATVAAGTYRLRACADAGHRIRERSERNNCRTARGRIAVLASPRPGPGTGHPHPGGPTPDPADVAPPVSTTIASSLGDTAAFLYTGADPVQAGVAPGTIKPQRVAVVRGRVTGRDGAPLAGVAVTVLDHPELGQTSTRADGMYDIAVNGGGPLTLAYAKAGRLPAQRTVATPWQDYAYVDDVALVTLDPHVTDVETGAGAPVQVVRGSEITDSDGTRQPTLIFDAGTTAQMELPNGTTRRLDDLHVRATEYTVGDAGPEAMPGDLPPTSGYTYAAELSVDEALAAYATDVRFSTPVAVYVENFPGFPVGGAVPAGYYDRERAAWVAARNGRVIKIIGESGGLADVDTDGDGAADDDGIDDAERGRLAALYDAGQELWRVEVSHFTPWDYNWPYGPPADAIRPNPLEPPDRAAAPPPGRKPDCFNGGSVIGCLSRTLGEGAEIVGTPYALRYSSERAPGRAAARSVVIPLSGPSVPASLKRIELEVTVAGQRVTRSFAPAPNASFTFVWDGRDAYGRKLQGEQPVTARIGFAYGAVYYPQPASFEASFGRIMRSGDARVIGRDQADIVLWNDWTGHVGGWDDADLGGWSIDVHHSYAPQSGTLYRGDGTRRGATDFNKVVRHVAGDGVYGSTGDGGQASAARLNDPLDVAAAPDGSLYVAERGVLADSDRIRRIGPNGTITTLLGPGQLGEPHGLALGDDGSLYIADHGANRIRRLSPAGALSTVAGNGQACPSGCTGDGDGGPATAAAVTRPSWVDVAPDGSVYFSDSYGNRVRRVGSDGVVTTVAGGGTSTADGVPATTAKIDGLTGMTLGPDGSVYVSDNSSHKVRRVTPDGLIVTVAGTGRRCGGGGTGCFGGDGGLAIAGDLSRPTGLAVDAGGTLYISDAGNRRIRRVTPDGIISTYVGTGQNCTITAEGDDCPDGAPAAQTPLPWSTGIEPAPDGGIYYAARHRLEKVVTALPSHSPGDALIASEDGDELYVFDSSGRHLETRDALTGAQRARFGYDGTGRLRTIADGDGRVTTIVRDGSGAPTAIVAPGGQRTTLAVDANGYLSQIEGPGGQGVTLTTDPGGLLAGLTEPGGAEHSFEYDDAGNLTRDTGPAGTKTLARTDVPGGWSVAFTTPTGRATTFTARRLPDGDVERSVSEPGAGMTQSVEHPDGSSTTTFPNGERLDVLEGPDPRFGMQAPVLVSATRTTPGGRTTTVTANRTVQLAAPGKRLDLVRLDDEATLGGKTTHTRYDAAARTITTTSPAGRTTVRTLDAEGRLTKLEPAPGVTPTVYAYTAHGEVQKVTQGTRTRTYAYDTAGRVVATTDAAGTATYTYDAGDRLLTATLPGGRRYRFAYDANGRRTALTLPSGAVHSFAFSPSGDPIGFTPAGNGLTSFSLTGERELAGVALPGGRMETYARDSAGMITGVDYDGAAMTFTGDPAGRLTGSGWTGPGGATQQTTFAYDGGTLTVAASTGAAPGTFAYDYDDELRLTAVQLDTEPKTARAYDADGLLTALGPFAFTRGDAGGLVSRISDSARRVDITHDARGRIASRTYSVGGTDVASLAFDYDDLDRVVARHERRGSGAVRTTAYTYDASGRLATVRVDGTLTESYAYDADGDRTSRRLPGGGTETASYDGRHLLDSRGGVDYAFDAAGFLTARGGVAFTYGTRGELLSAGSVTYAYDASGRRVRRTAGGVGTEYLYGNPEEDLEVTATRGPDGLTRYFRDESGHVFAFERGGERYLVVTDQVGSATAIVDAAGTIVKAVAYDSYGVETSDSNPAFPYPFGYAGGIGDETTGLVRFGMRDYDPEAGRWTARDPSLDGPNLYAYVGDDPVNHTDAAGLFSLNLSAYGPLGGGLRLTVTRKGFSWCGEVGAGVGTTLEIDPFSDLDKETLSVFGEGKVDMLGIVSAKLRGEIANPCGNDRISQFAHPEFRFKPEICAAMMCTSQLPDLRAKFDPVPKTELKTGFSAAVKVGIKGCAQMLW